mgnify:CR=1 FL=1
MSRPTGHTAVMAQRAEPPDALDFFPTPPWATRALTAHVIGSLLAPGDCPVGSRPPGAGYLPTSESSRADRPPGAESGPRVPAGSRNASRHAPLRAWEPAAGEGHMAAVLAETFDEVWRSDVHDYGGLNAVGSFVGHGPDVAPCPDPSPDWIITNPPFNLAVQFAERALGIAREGVALLLRTAWLEGADRYERLFRDAPPAIVAPFVERVPMVKGRWDPDASTATAYAWFVWDLSLARGDSRSASRPPRAATILKWIPPGCRTRLTRPGDRARFAQPSEVGGLLA